LDNCDLSSKTIVVTGANSGIGFEIAKYVLQKGAKRVISACRNVDAATKAAEELKLATGNSNIEVWQLDLSSFASVKTFASKYIHSGLPLHVLYNNAGVGALPKTMTSDGFEQMFQVNLLSTMLLTFLLWPVLEKHEGEPNRVVFTSSGGAYRVTDVPENLLPTPVEALSTTKKFEGQAESLLQYFTSKICLYAISVELAKRGKGKVLITTGDPGLVFNDFASKLPDGTMHTKKTMESMEKIFPGINFRTSEEGARMMLMPGTYPVNKIWHAGYASAPSFRTNKEAILPVLAQDPQFQKKVWEDTVRLLKVKPEEVGTLQVN